MIEVTEFLPVPHYLWTGFVSFTTPVSINGKSYSRTDRCRVRISKDRKTIWIELPVNIYNIEAPKKTYHSVWMNEKEGSDALQEEIKRQLQEKWPESLVIPEKKNGFKKHKKFIKEKIFSPRPTPGKARNASIFYGKK